MGAEERHAASSFRLRRPVRRNARRAVLISIWFDPADEGNLRRRVSYERPAS